MYPDPRKPPSCLDSARTVSSSLQPTTEPLDWAPDMDAVARLRDRGCFMRIYDHFMPRLCTYLRGLGASEAVAEELAQDCLLRLWLRAGEFDPARGALSTWLYRIARNLHIDRVRRERGWLQVQAAIEQAATDDMAASSSAEQYADQARLHQRVSELPAVQARLVRMSYFEAKSHGEIALALQMPLGTVKSHLRRAFLQLQSKVGGAK
ncbi:sigma-70 family RNA polymerase sigma factor [Pseudoxanthomonas dokdonensis]|uniref:RNA polymerase sigma factor RpoE n=1 Tax=Pseudoxanthomonas dokdonensis TaxID=344882 RepID=A0A0R0CLZ0_9GAMM|nr:sigma-70 family RNA polymerase sigma factor [Pseudoxanthomonas dokdonensis]KRG70587.1 RNA polymerase sigma factor RpoE [Pseudoxanthomonas dokdonensis]